MQISSSLQKEITRYKCNNIYYFPIFFDFTVIDFLKGSLSKSFKILEINKNEKNDEFKRWKNDKWELKKLKEWWRKNEKLEANFLWFFPYNFIIIL